MKKGWKLFLLCVCAGFAAVLFLILVNPAPVQVVELPESIWAEWNLAGNTQMRPHDWVLCAGKRAFYRKFRSFGREIEEYFFPYMEFLYYDIGGDYTEWRCRVKTAWVVLEDGKIKQERTPDLPAPELELEIGCGNSLEIFNQIAYAVGEEMGWAELCPQGTNRTDFRVRIGRKDLFRNDKLFEGGLELMRAAEETGTEEGTLSAVFRMGGQEIEEAWNFSYQVFAKTAGGHTDETE